MNPSAYSGTPFDPTPLLVPGGPLPPLHEDGSTAPGALPPIPPSADAHQVLRDVVGELNGKIRAKRLDVTWRLLARHTRVAADRDRLRQVYQVIVGSAVDAARPGGRLTIRSTDPSDCAVRVEVEERSPWLRRQPRPELAGVSHPGGKGNNGPARRSRRPAASTAGRRTGG